MSSPNVVNDLYTSDSLIWVILALFAVNYLGHIAEELGRIARSLRDQEEP